MIDGSVLEMEVMCTESNVAHTAVQGRRCKNKWLPCQTIVRQWRM